jgi:hypothetical protein
MKSCVSISLYGDGKKYCLGAISNALDIRKIYPGRVLRLWYDRTVPDQVIEVCRELGAECIQGPPWEGTWRMCWRFLDMDISASRETMLSRDADSRLTEREAWAVDDWLCAETRFAQIKDSSSHTAVVMGGLFQARCDWRGMRQSIEWFMCHGQVPTTDSYGNDQNFLCYAIWPYVKDEAITYGDYVPRYESIEPTPIKIPVPYQLNPGDPQGHCGCASCGDIPDWILKRVDGCLQ